MVDGAQKVDVKEVNDVCWRLRRRADIRRTIPDRKSVKEGKPDRIADLLEEAESLIHRCWDDLGEARQLLEAQVVENHLLRRLLRSKDYDL
jgi:hypothetical protein